MDLGGKLHQFYHSNGLNYATYARCQEIPYVTRASACHHALNDNYWHRLLEIPTIIGVESNITIFNHVCRFFLNMFYCGRNRLTNLNTPIWKAWGSASRAQRLLTTGIARRQFPSLRGTTWRSNGRSAWNGSGFEHTRAFYVEMINIHGMKMSCYNPDEDWSVGVCSPNAFGLVRNRKSNPEGVSPSVHWDNKFLQNRSQSLKYISSRYILGFVIHMGVHMGGYALCDIIICGR